MSVPRVIAERRLDRLEEMLIVVLERLREAGVIQQEDYEELKQALTKSVI